MGDFFQFRFLNHKPVPPKGGKAHKYTKALYEKPVWLQHEIFQNFMLPFVFSYAYCGSVFQFIGVA